MAAGKEIRGKIKSVENTKKITKAMEMVSVSKMRKAQERMRAARPYADKIRNITAHLSEANPEYKSPYMRTGAKGAAAGSAKAVGFIVITSDKGLCGGLNTNVLRAVVNKMKEVQTAGGSIQAVAIGNKGFGFLNRIGAQVISHAVQLGDAPQLDKLIGPVKVMLDAFVAGKLDAVYLCYTKFLNTMKQEPLVEPLLPLTATRLEQTSAEKTQYGWDYIYEPDAPTVIDDLLTRYIEALVYQGVAENMASEHSARMVAMKAATDNAGTLIGELKLIYNKTRQAAITKELSEIVSGAAAISG
jgi:F-type H+-transporting ATPase subunit gamma